MGCQEARAAHFHHGKPKCKATNVSLFCFYSMCHFQIVHCFALNVLKSGLWLDCRIFTVEGHSLSCPWATSVLICPGIWKKVLPTCRKVQQVLLQCVPIILHHPIPLLLCVLTRCPVPPDENQPHSMMLPPQYFTAGMVFGWYYFIIIFIFFILASVRSAPRHFEFWIKKSIFLNSTILFKISAWKDSNYTVFMIIQKETSEGSFLNTVYAWQNHSQSNPPPPHTHT